MKAVLKVGVILALSSSLLAQTAGTSKKTARKPSAPSSAAEIQALKDAVAAQQQQLQTLQQQLQQTNQQLQQTSQQFQQAQQQLQQVQQSAADAQQKAAAVESSSVQKDAFDKLNAQYADVQTTLTNNALSAQDEQKRVSALETTLGRFRWTGDVRVRDDSQFQSYSGCLVCADRNRPRIRVRFGFEGKLNDDFLAGVSIATGRMADPTSTNSTLTDFFQKKTIGLDRGYITYNPVAHKWLSLTGGKFAFTWQRTSVTFDPDLNPEGFVEKFSQDFTSVPVVKNVNLQFMQLFYSEANGVGGIYHGHDSFAVGGQIAGRLQPLKIWTLTPSFTILNFRYPDAILNASAFQVGATTGGGVFTINGTPTNLSFQVPGEGPGCATPGSAITDTKKNVPNCAFGPNGITNATYLDAKGNLHYLSGFLYADLILNNQFKTRWSRLPINVLLEYENNLNASEHPFFFDVTGTVEDPKTVWADGQDGRPNLGKQSHAYLADVSIGQQRNRGDLQFGYSFLRQEQDSSISSFGESDQRAPTNTLQHRIYALWRIRANTTASFTWWHGRTLNPFLQNAALASGLKPAFDESGVAGLICGSSSSCTTLPSPLQSDPWVNRFQFDLIYTF